MDIKIIKELVSKYNVDELNKFADEFEATGVAPVKTQEDAGDQMSDYLQAAEVRAVMDAGKPMNDALREFAQRVRGVLK
jgi:predicted HAD superfamily phosphohydrolase YqeG